MDAEEKTCACGETFVGLPDDKLCPACQVRRRQVTPLPPVDLEDDDWIMMSRKKE